MEEITIQIPFKIDGEFVDSVMCSAFEGGINYWCESAKAKDNDYKGAEYASEVISRGGTVVLKDAEEDETYEIDLDKFVKGYRKYVQWASEKNREVYTDPAYIDAEIADIIVQYAVFDEIVYG